MLLSTFAMQVYLADVSLRDTTICIKHTAQFTSRRSKLDALLGSIREHHGTSVHILVAVEHRDMAAAQSEEYFRHTKLKFDVDFVRMPSGVEGLSAGRNALVRAVRTPFAAVMDDDLLLENKSSLLVLRTALARDASASIAGGCMRDAKRGAIDCYNMRFETSSDGGVVRMRRAAFATHGCEAVGATHNFILGRTAALQAFPWDARQRVMEHETFFYQLHLNQVRVLGCPHAIVVHNTLSHSNDDYERASLRATTALDGKEPGRDFMQYLCKNFPEVRLFHTPFTTWRCHKHEFCTPLWDADFPFDGGHCAPFPWDGEEDESAVSRPLLVPYHTRRGGHDIQLHAQGMLDAPAPGRIAGVVPLLTLIITERHNVARRTWQRNTWLSFPWHALSQRDLAGHRLAGDGDLLVPWRHVYLVVSKEGSSKRRAIDMSTNDSVRAIGENMILGDTLPLKASESTTRASAVLAGLRWALAHVDFQTIFLTDDQSIVHIGRLWEWLVAMPFESLPYLTALGTPGAVSGSWAVGRHAARHLVHRKGRFRSDPMEKLGADMAKLPGYQRIGKRVQGANLSFRGQYIIDGVRRSDLSFKTFRAMLESNRSTRDVWTRDALSRSDFDCAGCEARYFDGVPR